MPADFRKIGKNNKVRGASVERLVAALYNGKRNRNAGQAQADVETKELSIEVKSLQRSTPQLLSNAWTQATSSAILNGKIPVVVLSYIDNGRRVYWEVRKVGENV